MKKLRVVFFGTPDFAVATLEAIRQSAHEVVAVVTAPDKAAGRGQKISQSAVKQYAVQHEIPCLQPEKLRNEEFQQALKYFGADIFIVVAFRMMPKSVYAMPRLGTFNVHASLLPQYRGAAPINFAIMNGEKQTGVTTFFLNDKIDEGEILLQSEVEISAEDTAGTLHDKLMTAGGKLAVETLDRLAENSLQPQPQPTAEILKLAYKIHKEDMRINWQRPLPEIHNFIRGLSPYPAAWTSVKTPSGSKNLKIFSGTFEEFTNPKPFGEIEITKKQLRIHLPNGVYLPTELQLEGKKRLPIHDFLNGLPAGEIISISE